MLHIAHIINPVKIKPESDLYVAQPITFASILKAKQFTSTNIHIELFTAQYPEDHEIIPDYFIRTPDLRRSIIDFKKNKYERKLPILNDILERLYQQSNADYFIYTNIDIGLQPHFYDMISLLIKKGYDAFTINRRAISDEYNSIDEFPAIYSDLGTAHPGHDCFVFKRDLYNKFEKCNACLGINQVGKFLLLNLIANSTKFKIFKNEHLTFHIGSDRIWQNPKYSSYENFNKEEIRKMVNLLIYKNPALTSNKLFLRQTSFLKKTYKYSIKRKIIYRYFTKLFKGVKKTLIN